MRIDMDKVDRLFLRLGCPLCGSIRATMNMDLITDASFLGKSNQSFYVFASLTKAASIDLLEKFNLNKYDVPILVTHKGEIYDKTNKIIGYLKAQTKVVK